MKVDAAAIERCFREQLAKSDYRSVSVLGMCEQMGVTRKVFYAFFESKEDIVRAVFSRDVVRPMADLLELIGFDRVRQLEPSMQERVFQAVLDDGDFYRNLVIRRRGGATRS